MPPLPLLRAHLLPIALGVAAVAALLVPASGAGALARAEGAHQVGVITTGLVVPWDIAFLPDGRALVTERGGAVRIVSPAGALSATPAARVSVTENGEGGLLGIAIDPAFASGAPYVYLTATPGSEMQVQRWRFAGSTMTFDGVVVDGIPMGTIHSSGRVRFGPDGALYVGTGDAGVPARAQDPTSRNGKVLRVPPGAFRGGGVAPEVVATGLRHPQGIAWQPGSGRLYATEHGPSGFDGVSGDDELNLIVPGGNYGWPHRRGWDQSPYHSPAHLWPTTIAPSGIAFLALPGSAWSGKALVAGLKGKVLRLLSFDGARVVADEALLLNQYGRLRAVAEAPDGAVWVTTSNRDGRGTPVSADDRIIRIVPPAGEGDLAALGAEPGAWAEAPAAVPPAERPATPRRAAPAAPGLLTLTAPASVRAGARARVVAVFSGTPGRVALQARRAGRWHTLRLATPSRAVVRFAFRPRTPGAQVMRVRYRSAGRSLDRPLRMRVRPA